MQVGAIGPGEWRPLKSIWSIDGGSWDEVAVCKACGCQAIDDRLGRNSRERGVWGAACWRSYGLVSDVCLFDLPLTVLTTPLAVIMRTSVFGQGLLIMLKRGVSLGWRGLNFGIMSCPLCHSQEQPHSGPDGSTRRQRDRASIVMSYWRKESVTLSPRSLSLGI